MSIYIKNMKMPERCWDCDLCYDSLYCIPLVIRFSDREDFEPGERRLSDCPLIPVPEHGDLIDRDALPMNRVEWEDIVNAPTIIPADKEGEG